MLAGRVIEVLNIKEKKPLHPYAKLLFDPWGYPLPDKELSKNGCPFHSNCSIMLQSLCETNVPNLKEVGNEHEGKHYVSCYAISESMESEEPVTRERE